MNHICGEKNMHKYTTHTHAHVLSYMLVYWSDKLIKWSVGQNIYTYLLLYDIAIRFNYWNHFHIAQGTPPPATHSNHGYESYLIQLKSILLGILSWRGWSVGWMVGWRPSLMVISADDANRSQPMKNGRSGHAAPPPLNSRHRRRRRLPDVQSDTRANDSVITYTKWPLLLPSSSSSSTAATLSANRDNNVLCLCIVCPQEIWCPCKYNVTNMRSGNLCMPKYRAETNSRHLECINHNLCACFDALKRAGSRPGLNFDECRHHHHPLSRRRNASRNK